MVSTFSNIFLLFGEAFLFMLWEIFMQRGTRTVKLSRRICEKFLTNSTGSGKRKIKYCMAVVIKYLQLKSLFLWCLELEFWMVWYFTRHKIIVSYYTVNCACLFYFSCFFRVFFFRILTVRWQTCEVILTILFANCCHLKFSSKI